MRLYYYTSKQFGMKSLWEKRLKVGKYEELNDPFELQAYKPIEQIHRKFIDAVIDALSRKWGVICFSETWKSNLMWAHYADKHRGLCLGFDIPEGPTLTKIKYVKSRIEIPENFKESLDGIVKDIFPTILEAKSSQWAYEKERRLRIRLQEKRDGIYYQKFDSILTLSEVIIGSRCKLSIEDVKDALGKPDSDVDIWAVKPARTQFSMVANKAFGRERIFGTTAAQRKAMLLADLLRHGSK